MSEAGIGHNSEGVLGDNGIMPSASTTQLKAFIERIERMEEEKDAISGDIKDIYGEAKGTGFDTKVIRKIVALRKMDAADRQSQLAVMDLYMQALGMV